MINRFCAALLPLACFAFAASAAEPAAAPAASTAAPAPATDPVVARVNGEEIHASDVAQFYAGLPEQVHQLPISAISNLLVDRLVERKLLVQAGLKAKLQDGDEVKREVRDAEERAVGEAYLAVELGRRITPEALDAAYKKLVADFKPKDEVKAAHILVSSEAEAKKLIVKLKKGADFAKLAHDKSKDTGSAAQGGDLGYFEHDAMVAPFADAAFAMKPGEIGKKPVKTQFGWHIIKVEDRRLSSAPKLADVKDDLESKLRKDAIDAVVKDLRVTAKVETFQLDGSPVLEKKAIEPEKQ
jgi:peptidyl-prolyl cis-trans isomerase C